MTGVKMSLKLTKESEELLRGVLAKHRPELLNLIDPQSEAELDNAQLDELSLIVNDEFLETGLHEDDEPNSRGLALESLIDELNNLQS